MHKKRFLRGEGLRFVLIIDHSLLITLVKENMAFDYVSRPIIIFLMLLDTTKLLEKANR